MKVKGDIREEIDIISNFEITWGVMVYVKLNDMPLNLNVYLVSVCYVSGLNVRS